MKIVVPLAGPDFDRADGSTKAEHDVYGLPLLRRGVESRSWWRRGECSDGDLVFVLRDSPAGRAFVDRSLAVWYPEARIVWLQAATQGAALSALAGVAAVAHCDEPLGIDLCDILYTEDVSPQVYFDAAPGRGGLGLAFSSDNPLYSYFRRDTDGRVVETAEKRVISDLASAGTYWFRSPSVYLAALAENLAQPAEVTVRSLFFVCPVFNGVIARGLDVGVATVSDVHDIKMLG